LTAPQGLAPPMCFKVDVQPSLEVQSNPLGGEQMHWNGYCVDHRLCGLG
jgi:hypothetical protein